MIRFLANVREKAKSAVNTIDTTIYPDAYRVSIKSTFNSLIATTSTFLTSDTRTDLNSLSSGTVPQVSYARPNHLEALYLLRPFTLELMLCRQRTKYRLEPYDEGVREGLRAIKLEGMDS